MGAIQKTLTGVTGQFLTGQILTGQLIPDSCSPDSSSLDICSLDTYSQDTCSPGHLLTGHMLTRTIIIIIIISCSSSINGYKYGQHSLQRCKVKDEHCIICMGYYHKLSPMLSLTDFVISIPFLRAIFTQTQLIHFPTKFFPIRCKLMSACVYITKQAYTMVVVVDMMVMGCYIREMIKIE